MLDGRYNSQLGSSHAIITNVLHNRLWGVPEQLLYTSKLYYGEWGLGVF